MHTAIAKARPMLRLNQRAVSIPTRRSRWHEIASTTAGLTKGEFAVLSAVAEITDFWSSAAMLRPPPLRKWRIPPGAKHRHLKRNQGSDRGPRYCRSAG
jgi:hypothetical protein